MFAPVFRPGRQPSSLALHQKTIRKRKRAESDTDEDSDRGSETLLEAEETTPKPQTSSFHPVNRTDQYYVAGHPREDSVPVFPFPHAAAIRPPRKGRSLLDKDLQQLNPPLYVPPSERGLHPTSIKRQHVENLTAILHACMLQGDWKRASRTWGLLLRTEIGGRGIDIRKHERWAVGAELLMRRDQQLVPRSLREQSVESDFESHSSSGLHPERNESSISDQGFQLAKEYYERLILQYPHTSRTQHRFTSLAIYPALFNVWIFEVQDRSKRARQRLEADRPGSPQSDISETSIKSTEIVKIRRLELTEGLNMMERMDDLLLSPPFDTSIPLLHLRGLAGLWMADLYSELSDQNINDNSEIGISVVNGLQASHALDKAELERRVAYRLLVKIRDSVRLPDNIARFIQERQKIESRHS